MALGTVSVTAAIDPTSRWVNLQVTCTGMTSCTINRIVDGQTQTVRGALNKACSDALNSADYEPPQNAALSYVALVSDGVSTKTSSIVEVSGTIDRGSDIIYGLTNPLAVQPVHVVGIPELRTTSRQDVVNVVNRPDPVIVSDVRTYAAGTLTLATLTDAERSGVESLLSSGAVIAFAPRYDTYGFNEVWYLSVGAMSVKRVSKIGTRPERLIDLEFQRVAPPPADFIGPAFRTWQDVYDAGTTWGDLLAAGTTWLRLQVT